MKIKFPIKLDGMNRKKGIQRKERMCSLRDFISSIVSDKLN